MILVTGATSIVGLELTKSLFDRGLPVRVFVRDRSRAKYLSFPGIELVIGDFARPATFDGALAGVDQLFLLVPSSSQSEQQLRNFVDAAKHARVKHIVQLSRFGAHADSSGRSRRRHAAIEYHIMKSRIPYTFLRPNLFMQSLLGFRSVISFQGTLYASAGAAKVSVIDVRDVADVAAAALTQSIHEGRTYELTGPEALSYTEMASQLSQGLGKPIEYIDMPPQAMLQTLLDLGVPAWRADGLMEDYDYCRRAEAAAVTTAVYDVIHREPTRFSQFAADYAHQFAGKAAGA
jgi:uncharacterized protein YbjT (DUF2867 family)